MPVVTDIQQLVSEAESDKVSAYHHRPSQLAIAVARGHIDEFAVSHGEFGDFVTSPLPILVEDATSGELSTSRVAHTLRSFMDCLVEIRLENLNHFGIDSQHVDRK